MRRIRVILYEGDERQFAHQFGTPDAPRGLADGVHEGLATRITIASIDDPKRIDEIVDAHLTLMRSSTRTSPFPMLRSTECIDEPG